MSDYTPPVYSARNLAAVAYAEEVLAAGGPNLAANGNLAKLITFAATARAIAGDDWDLFALESGKNVGTGTTGFSFRRRPFTLVNGPTWATTGITFDSDNDYVRVGHLPIAGAADVGLTAIVLFNRAAVPNSNSFAGLIQSSAQSGAFSIGDAQGTTSKYSAWILNSGTVDANNQSGVLSAATWTTFGAVYDRSLLVSSMRVFTDGSLTGTQTDQGDLTMSNDWVIGTDLQTGDRGFGGTIAAALVLYRAVTNTEYATLNTALTTLRQ